MPLTTAIRRRREQALDKYKIYTYIRFNFDFGFGKSDLFVKYAKPAILAECKMNHHNESAFYGAGSTIALTGQGVMVVRACTQ